MRIILTDCEKYCPVNDFKSLYRDVFFVKAGYSLKDTINRIGGGKSIIAVVGSRALVKSVQSSLNDFPNLKFIQLSSTGFDDISPSLFQSSNILISNAPGVYDETVAEYAVYMMLKYAKRYHSSLKNTNWRPFRNYHYMTELKGKTVGIMGVGNIGSRIACLLCGFEMRVIGFAKTTRSKLHFEFIYHKDGLNTFLEQCDFIINALPDNEDSKGLLNKDRFSIMKDSVVFINVGRETVYVKEDLVNFFLNNKNAVGILDIFELIPKFFDKFHRLHNIYITPRISAYSKESDNRLRKLVKENLLLFLSGKKPNYQLG